MSQTIGALDIAITANTAAFVAGTQRARNELRSFSAQTNTALAGIDRGVTRSSAMMGTLINRYLRWTIVIGIGVTLMRNVAKQHDETGKNAQAAIDNMARAWNNLQNEAAPALTWLTNRLADVVSLTAQATQGIANLFDAERMTERGSAPSGGLTVQELNRRRFGGGPVIQHRDQFVRSYGFPDTIAVTPAAPTPGIAAIMAGDATVNAGLREFTGDFGRETGASIAAAHKQIAAERSAASMTAAHNAIAALEEEKRGIIEFTAEAGRRWDDYYQRQAEMAQENLDAQKAALTDIRVAAVSAFMEGGDAVGYFLKQLAAMIIELKVIRPLVESLSFGGGGGLFGFGLLDFGGGRAAGGPVSAGTAYTVGEHGPETLIMGSSSGRIVPNAGGITVNVDARGSDMSEAKLARMVSESVQLAIGGTLQIVTKRHRSRGGSF